MSGVWIIIGLTVYSIAYLCLQEVNYNTNMNCILNKNSGITLSAFTTRGCIQYRACQIGKMISCFVCVLYMHQQMDSGLSAEITATVTQERMLMYNSTKNSLFFSFLFSNSDPAASDSLVLSSVVQTCSSSFRRSKPAGPVPSDQCHTCVPLSLPPSAPARPAAVRRDNLLALFLASHSPSPCHILFPSRLIKRTPTSAYNTTPNLCRDIHPQPNSGQCHPITSANSLRRMLSLVTAHFRNTNPDICLLE